MRFIEDLESFLASGLPWVMAGTLLLCALRLCLPMRRLEPACRKCRYPLKGLPDSQQTCPECGRVLTLRDRSPIASWKAWPIPIRPVTLATFGVVLGLMAVVMSRLELGNRVQSVHYGLNQPITSSGGMMLNSSTQAVWKDTVLRGPWPHRWNLVIWRRLESEPVFMGIGVGNAYPSLPMNWTQDAERFHSALPLIVSDWSVGRANIQPMVDAAVSSLGNDALKTWKTQANRAAKDIESIYLGYPRLRNGPDHVTRSAATNMPAQWNGSMMLAWLMAAIPGVLVIWGVRHIERRVSRKREAAMDTANDT